ncbi:MAG: serine O-acetyltransferase [Oscillospiraceae bacterium]|jgi:serine O-acetyltransferase|nr:serine O-acetyltransferase [Oscillospiraceae bacterium]
MFNRLREDIMAVRKRDPAARSLLEILFLYPGLKAVRMHRRAHWCWTHGLRFIARWISQRAVRKTNIEIHPGATIGRRLFIDHGTGVVIGETAELGDDCVIYQGVTLGGTGKDVGKRHPTLGNEVLVGAGAKLLGPFTVGSNSKIAAGAVVLHDIPANCTAVGVPAKVVKMEGRSVEHIDNLQHASIPDPVQQEICQLQRRIYMLENDVRVLGMIQHEDGSGI